MSAAGYWFERFCLFTYAPFVFYTALYKSDYFQHLTYWALTAHALYYTVDKASPQSSKLTALLHALSFMGSIAILFGYTCISVFGGLKFGSWLAWENAVGGRAGTVLHDRGWWECAPQKLYEHLWPLIASFIDLHYSKDSLAAHLKGARPVRTTIFAVLVFVVYGTTWEMVQKSKGKVGDPLDVYVQPDYLTTQSILNNVGISGDFSHLPKDLIFTNVQKVCMIATMVYLYWKYVTPLMADGKKKSTAKKTK